MMPASPARRLFGILLALAVCASGCGSPAPPTYPGELLPVSELGPDRLVRQRIHGERGEERWDTEVVLQKQGDRLLLLALTPFGTRMFAIEQRGDGSIEVTTYVDRPLPFPPRFVLLDVHRALFGWLAPGPLSDGLHEAERGGERIVERWRGGALEERTFERLDGEPAGRVRVEYVDGMRPGILPRRIRLENDQLGYTLEIETLSERPL